MKKRFTKNIEDFVCEHCDKAVKGNGYTNHCPHCLWSKHVDINPGDREALCLGMMKPIKLELEKNEHIITHECVICGYCKRNKLSNEDDFDIAIEVTKPKS
jgi:uncharacterized CHY-type Zn-finger protein